MPDAVDIGSRLELFVDRWLVESLDDAAYKLHTPQPAPADAGCIRGGYVTVLPDGDRYRAYYSRAKPKFNPREHVYQGGKWGGTWGDCACYSESLNIIDEYPFGHSFSPFLDMRPDVPDSERYKAVSGGTRDSGLHTFASADGIHWRKLGEEPVVVYNPELHGDYAFDSQNVAFWSQPERRYLCFFRHSKTPHGKLRSIGRASSEDFLDWSDESATFAAPNLPGEHLYTSQTHPYFRAPHIYIALPTRFLTNRNGATDILFMATRAGADRYERLFTEALIRPGLDPQRWGNRANYAACGALPTGPGEISLYHGSAGRRYTLRTDGFISIHAGSAGGRMTTRPFIFTGSALTLNLSTSAGGHVRVELQDDKGRPLPGRALADCPPIFTDAIEHTVTWKSGGAVSDWAGEPVRLCIELQEADLYALRFE